MTGGGRRAFASAFASASAFAFAFVFAFAGICRAQTADAGGWRSVLGTVAAGDPGAVSPDYQEGVARLRAGDTAAAVEKLRAAWAQNPTSAVVAEELGLGLDRLGARREAENLLRKAIALDGRRPSAYVNLAELMSRSPERWQRQAELLAFFAQGLSAVGALPDEGRGRQALGIAVAGFEAGVGQLAAARRRLETLLAAPLPATLHKRARDRLTAIEEEERARTLADWPEPSLAPGDAAALAAAGRALEGGDARAALAGVSPLVERHPGSANARFLRARALQALERSDEAERELALVVQLKPSHARAWRLLGQILADRGVLEAERADDALRRALALEPSWDDLRDLRRKVARKRQGLAGEVPAAPAPPPPSDRARALLEDAQRWIGVDAPEVATVSLRDALADSPAYVEAAAALYALTGELLPATEQALWSHGPSLVRLGEALLRVRGDADATAQTAAKVRPWLDRAVALGAPEARFVRALLLVEEGNTAGALAELTAYAASGVAPPRLGEALALRSSLEAPPAAGEPEARARTLLLAGRADQAARVLGGACRGGLSLAALLELGRIEEYEARPLRALECYRLALAAAGKGAQAAAGRRAALERLALLAGYAPAESLASFTAEIEQAAQAGVPAAHWASSRIHARAGRWAEAAAKAETFLAHTASDDPLRTQAQSALAEFRRRVEDVRRRRWFGLWAGLAVVVLALVALVVRAVRRRRAWDVATALERAPDLYPEVASAVAEVRHDILKHRASALGLLAERDAAGVGRREEIRRQLLEPLPTSEAVAGAYERLQRAGGAVGIVLRPLEREPVFGPLVRALARAEELLERAPGTNAVGDRELAEIDRSLRAQHGPALARLAASGPRTRLDPAEVAGWMRRLAPAGGGRALQPGLHLPALDVELPITAEALHTILSNLVRNAMTAVGDAGERGGEARVLVRLEEERDAVGRRLVTLLVADSARATLSLEDIERRDGQRGLGIVRDLVRRWGGHLVVRTERPPLVKAIGAAFPRAVDPAPAAGEGAGPVRAVGAGRE